MPVLKAKRLKEVIIYGNPVLGPSGEDPIQARVEMLVDTALSPSCFGREQAVDIITDIPRDKIVKKGHIIGRQARYRDFNMKEVHCQFIRSIRSLMRGL